MKYTLNLDDELHREFKIYCVTNRLDMSEVMRSLIERVLDGQISVFAEPKAEKRTTKKSK